MQVQGEGGVAETSGRRKEATDRTRTMRDMIFRERGCDETSRVPEE